MSERHPKSVGRMKQLWKHVEGCPYCAETGGLDAPRSLLCVRGRMLYDLFEMALAAEKISARKAPTAAAPAAEP